jgi:ankyrin repeat protein
VKKRIIVVVVPAVLMAASAYAQTTDFFKLVQIGTPEQIQAGITAGADVNDRAENGDSEIEGDLDSILRHAPDFIPMFANATPLIFAAAFNPDARVTEILLGAGAKADDRQEPDGPTALMYAAAYNPNPDVISVLLEAGANPNAKAWEKAESDKTCSSCITPLMCAAACAKNPGVISTLVKGGARVNDTGNLMLMLRNLSEFYLKGAKPLLFAAVFNPNPEIIASLLNEGAKIEEQKGSDLGLLLLWAAVRNTPEVIAALVKAGLKVEARDDNGDTPLIFAVCYNNDPLVAKMLLQAGAKVDGRNDDGVTALMCASNLDVISILLKAGANPKLRSKEGKSAFDYAKDNRDLKGTEEYEALRQGAGE